MEIHPLFILQIIAHLLADYSFQSKKMARKKDQKGFKSKQLGWHILIVTVCHVLLGLDLYFLPVAFAIASTHYIIDGFKPQLLDNKYTKKYAFFIDQTAHLLLLITAVCLYLEYFIWQPVFDLGFNTYYLALFAAFLICTKPANILIREIFNTYDIYFEGGDEDLPNAGRLIGIVERWLVLIFILMGQFAAVGFLIGAKSILRFKDANLLKTEYVLVGTLLSFGIAVVIAVLLNALLY